jgi:hypothetical protein
MREGQKVRRRNTMQKILTAILMTMLFAGCATPRIPFPETEFVGIDLSGDKIITGKVFLVDQLEEKQIGSGFEVILEPVSSYSDQWYNIVYTAEKELKKADPRYEKYVKRVTADAEGKYVLKDIAPGKYYLTSPFYWEAIDCAANLLKTKVLISKKITVTETDNDPEIPLTKEFISPTVICDIYTQGKWEQENDHWSVMK